VAQIDDVELALKQKCTGDPKNTDLKYELASYLIEKRRWEDAIDVLIDCIKLNKKDKKAIDQIMEIFKKLGAANEAVKKGRKKVASLLF
jgi:thioredoxin-like negative regulator of GroEL